MSVYRIGTTVFYVKANSNEIFTFQATACPTAAPTTTISTVVSEFPIPTTVTPIAGGNVTTDM
jgi:hypothetical protein